MKEGKTGAGLLVYYLGNWTRPKQRGGVVPVKLNSQEESVAGSCSWPLFAALLWGSGRQAEPG